MRMAPVFLSWWTDYWKAVGEAMPGALANTVIGICIVFFALLFISFVISRFKYISIIEAKIKAKKEAKKQNAELPQQAIENTVAQITEAEELSGMGAAFMGGLALGLYREEKLWQNSSGTVYAPRMAHADRARRYSGWRDAENLTTERQKKLRLKK